MKKQPSPQPKSITSYFFQHLVPTDAPAQTDENYSAGVCAAMSPETAAVLQSTFTPAEVASLQQRSTTEEHHNSETLESFLEASWRRVEDVIARNKIRRQVLEDELPKALVQVEKYAFWTPEGAAKRYNFPLAKDFGLASNETVGDMNDNRAALLVADRASADMTQPSRNGSRPSSACEEAKDEASLPAPQPAPQSGSQIAATAAPGKHRANVWCLTEKDLLNPSKSPNCLRRLFAPILQRRHDFHKSLTLLLNSLQLVQTEALPEIERLMKKNFDLPMHRPFRCISSFFMRYLTSPPEGQKHEGAFLDFYKPTSKAMEDAREKLQQLKTHNVPSSSQSGALELIYTTLLAELRERKSLHESCSNHFQTITKIAEMHLEEVEKGLHDCDEESRGLICGIEKDVAAYVAVLTEGINRRKAAGDEIEMAYQRDRELLQNSIESKKYRARKSEELQEKHARRIREVAKEWYVEQLKYEALLQEIIAESLSLQQLDQSHNQLKNLLGERISSKEYEARRQSAEELCNKSEELRAYLIAQCRQHIERVKSEEHYRRCRILSYAKDNALKWSRCLQDLATLYGSHHDTLLEKCDISMQFRYLLACEKEQLAKDLHQLQHELGYLETEWNKLALVLDELELPVPSLTQFEMDKACQELRCIMCEYDRRRLIRGEFAHLAPPVRKVNSPTPAEANNGGMASVDE